MPRDMQGTDLSSVVLGMTDRGPDSAFFQIFVPFAGDRLRRSPGEVCEPIAPCMPGRRRVRGCCTIWRTTPMS